MHDNLTTDGVLPNDVTMGCEGRQVGKQASGARIQPTAVRLQCVVRPPVPSLRRQHRPRECVVKPASRRAVRFSFRSLKTIDLNVRPIHHRLADRVRAHLFLRVLAHYVGWHKRVELQLSDSSPAWRVRSRSVAGCRT